VPGFGLGRDGCRTPMPWNGSAHAGFSAGRPWLPLGNTHSELNVAEQRRDPKSIYHLYRFLIALRKERKALSLGTYDLLSATDNLLIYRREFGTDRLAIALNLSSEPRDVCIDGHEITGRVLISSISGHDGQLVQSSITLPPNDGIIIDMSD
jgi:alpha-glucosidase